MQVLKGVVNARDLGGLPVPGNLRVKEGLLLRAAHLADATDADIRYLSGLPVVKVIDFRRDEEKKFDLRKIIVMAAFNE